MCGIVGYLGNKPAQDVLMACLARLEYRGYDSAGMATLDQGLLGTRRSAGNNGDLQRLLTSSPLAGNLGIAHTRWASHGEPSDINAHPHTDCSGAIAIVHNGIVENYDELREELEQAGHRLASQTDSEVIAHLIEANLTTSLSAAMLKTLGRLRGSYAIAAISQHEPDRMVVARHGGPPLVIGHGNGEIFIASDVTAILSYTRDIQILEDGEVAVITRQGASITLLNGDPVTRNAIQVVWEAQAADKCDYEHFMLKEIFEQPRAVMNTVKAHVQGDGSAGSVAPLQLALGDLADVSRLTIVACGSSWHAALVGKHLIESIGGVSVDVDIASEYRYRPLASNPDELVIGISQSGETADTLGALRAAKANGAAILAICNVAGSSMSRDADIAVFTDAGPEIGVASTKTFTCQITALVMVAMSLGVANGRMSPQAAEALALELMQLPMAIERILARAAEIQAMAPLFEGCVNALFLGRGIMFPLAIEGALKLKEISYIHAEGYPAGELKHGPIALITHGLPVVVIATASSVYEKVLAAIQEVKARGGLVLVIAEEGDKRILAVADYVFYLPRISELLMPVLAAVPLQLLAYYTAIARGCNVDKPRNLAKSVTVE